jgi:glycerophosphoryl diester phosphodiesterase
LKKSIHTPKIYGNGGDPHRAPQNTKASYWAALGGGADGLALSIKMSSDEQLVCSSYENLLKCFNVDQNISSIEYQDLARLDGGATFRSTTLDADNKPTGETGKDLPWIATKQRRSLIAPLLKDVLVEFGRRTSIIIFVPDNRKIIDAVVAELQKYGLDNAVLLALTVNGFNYVTTSYPDVPLVLIGDGTETHAPASEVVFLYWEQLQNQILTDWLHKSQYPVILGSEPDSYAPDKHDFDKSVGRLNVVAIVTNSVLATAQLLHRPTVIDQEDFSGNKIDTTRWAVGYSHPNKDTLVSQSNGLIINIVDGGEYSGAAAIYKLPIHGRFDVQVSFEVSNPQQGTTFELAAICVDPGTTHLKNDDLDVKNINLSFDVHGAPPYASSERDENDGFRFGWNNSFTLTRFDSNWSSISANMYNQYGRDVGASGDGPATGELRLIRNEQVFSSYYRDKNNSEWVCSGAMLVQNMSEDCYIRIAAKHWDKDGMKPPPNRVVFRSFRIFQFLKARSFCA